MKTFDAEKIFFDKQYAGWGGGGGYQVSRTYCQDSLILLARCAHFKKSKNLIFVTLKIVEKLTHQPPASCLLMMHIVMSLWRHVMEDNINI